MGLTSTINLSSGNNYKIYDSFQVLGYFSLIFNVNMLFNVQNRSESYIERSCIIKFIYKLNTPLAFILYTEICFLVFVAVWKRRERLDNPHILSRNYRILPVCYWDRLLHLNYERFCF